MSGRYKGGASKPVVTAQDLAELAEIHRRLQHLHRGLNPASSQQLPLMAASATVKAAWAELSGAGWAWSYPATAVPMNGIAGGPGAARPAVGEPGLSASPWAAEETTPEVPSGEEQTDSSPLET